MDESFMIQQKHYDAFNLWFSYTQEGDSIGEAIHKVALEYGMTDAGVRRWYDKMDWKTLSKKRLAHIQKELERQQNRDYARNKRKYLDIFHRLLYEYVEDGLPAKIESINDLEKVVKNSLLLQDQPTEKVANETRVSGELEVEHTEPLFNKERMKQILEKEQKYNKQE